jgi:hypothetical protein
MDYDEWGVVIPPPARGYMGEDRYDDEHRGPAVREAYSLSRCWIDLAEHSRSWPSPASISDHLKTIAEGKPADQRDAWLKDAANRKEVDRLLSYAIQSGELPIWVAPKDQPETPVPAESILEMDHATLVSGTYRPPNDRGWLYGRPLFVKRDDWVRFVAKVEADKTLTVAPSADKPMLPPAEPFVTLSHALSWIAFGVSMRSDQLHEVLSEDRYGEHDPQEAIKAAAAQLTSLARRGTITLHGKYRESHRDEKRTLLTAPIEPIKLADYRQFNYLADELRHGEGLTWWRTDKGVIDRLVSGGRHDSYIDVSVDRVDLLREFPPEVRPASESERFRVGHAFTRDDPASIAPWWSVNQALAWVATRIPSYVEYIGSLEAHEPRDYRPYFVQAICESQVAESDECKALMGSRRASWPAGSYLAHAGRALLKKILAGQVAPMTRDNGQGRKMGTEEFVGVGSKETGGDWLDLEPQPLFSSAELMQVFPMGEAAPTRAAIRITSTAGAESECRDWLVSEFAADPHKQRKKSDFQAAALAKFPERLSVRGFIRAWDAVAPQAGRSKPGRRS